jgi:hypothetical protein
MARAAGGKKFSKMNVARVYFGNWLRDYCELNISLVCRRWGVINVASSCFSGYAGWRKRSQIVVTPNPELCNSFGHTYISTISQHIFWDANSFEEKKKQRTTVMGNMILNQPCSHIRNFWTTWKWQHTGVE